MRLTKIICTLGPVTKTAEQIRALSDAGMDIARVNVSHGTREEHRETIGILKKLNGEKGRCIGILLDTKGAEIRTRMTEVPLEVEKGEEIVFSPHPLPDENQKVVLVSYDGFADDVRETDRILIDNGELSFDIVSINDDGTVVGRAREKGDIGSRRHINLPGADIDLPSVTEKDWDDIAFAVEEDVDFIALSFVRTAKEVQDVQRFLDEHKSAVRLISKIETSSAVENIADIVDASKGIMVARGDLGADVPFEKLPVIQDQIVARCIDAGKPVIVATHMLESMIEHPVPTRAEVTDVAHAALTGSDATMLSGETAVGSHPIQAVSAMDRILRETEKHKAKFTYEPNIGVHDDDEARGEAAASLTRSSNASVLMVFTRSGSTVQHVSRFRPSVPIIALTPSASVQRKLQLVYSVYPHVISFGEPEDTVQAGIAAAKEAGILKKGDSVVLVSDTKAKDAPVSSVQVRKVD